MGKHAIGGMRSMMVANRNADMRFRKKSYLRNKERMEGYAGGSSGAEAEGSRQHATGGADNDGGIHVKHGKKPTVAQRKLIGKWHMDAAMWLVVKDTPAEMVLVHRHFDNRTKTIKKAGV